MENENIVLAIDDELDSSSNDGHTNNGNINDGSNHDNHDKSPTNMNDIIEKEKKEMLSEIFKMYPKLKTDEKKIMEKCFKKSKKDDKFKYKEEIVLEQITINNKKYYKDTSGGIWNDKANIVGVINNNKYILF
jgi:hypothetical protein